jgi:EF-P beta-lysylation protein EpmB
MTRCETTNRADEILATAPDFVPTAFARPTPEIREPRVDWQAAMKRAIRTSVELKRALGLGLDSGQNEALGEGERSFPTFVPWEYLSRVRSGDPNDPLLRQVLPVAQEDVSVDGFKTDPVGDLISLAAPGILHKYQGRALVITTGACGVHCRYCFRRAFPYAASGSISDAWGPSLDYLSRRRDVTEVLLSGGDPLTLTDAKLEELIAGIEAIPHVRRLRIHSRMPIVIPQRITDELVARLRLSRLTVWMVIHANHPNELDESVFQRLAMLVDAGIPVLNQSVLLRGVNDDPQVLADLCLKLVDHRVQPYYLHQLDRVRGAAHFEVPVSEGRRLMQQLRTMLPGYAVPTYVAEQSGEASKTPLW